jgi:hydroxyethylthiazole kinase-like uncharacterized protein yjeF
MTPQDISRETLPDLAKGQGHKYTHGHALVLSGGLGKSGAARLAARAALRIGAGLVTVACPRSALAENAAQLTAIMLRAIDGPAGLEEMLEDDRVSSMCLGPGLGLTKATADLVKVALDIGKPTVLDADGLSRFARAPEALFGLLHDRAVITPHLGEFRRLFPDLADTLSDPTDVALRSEVTKAAAARAGCIVLLKGEQTLIAAPDGTCAVHSATGARATPWLATAGAGDVLAGMIAGLLTRGMAPFDAACAATWLHVDCARHFGPGLIAEDLSEQLPVVLKDVLSRQANTSA